MKKKIIENEESDENDVDEPSEVEELQNNGTDDDWSPTPEQKGLGKRRSGRAKATKRSYEAESTDGSDDEGESGGTVGKKKGGGTGRGGRGGGGRGRGRGRGGGGGGGAASKKTKTDEEEEVGETSSESDSEDTPSEFKSGAYVVLKSDFKAGGEHPIWKIDGKSLLQKFVYEKDEEPEPTYKSTTIYAGWSKSSKDSYYPINVDMKLQKGKDLIVTFDRNQVKVEEEKEN